MIPLNGVGFVVLQVGIDGLFQGARVVFTKKATYGYLVRAKHAAFLALKSMFL